MNWRQLLLGEFAIDHEYETYYKSWMVYHQTADQIDGHIKYPRDSAELYLVGLAARCAIKAQEYYLHQAGLSKPSISSSGETWSKWRDANREALRRLGR